MSGANIDVTHFPVLIIAVPLFSAFLTPLVSRIGPRTRNAFVIFALFITEALVLLLTYHIFTHDTISVYVFGAERPTLTLPSGCAVPVRIIFEVDALGAFMAMISTTVALLAAIYSWAFMSEKYALDKYYTLFLLVVVGMLGMQFTGDLFNMFVFLEIMSIAAAALVATRTDRGESAEAAFKYMLVSATGAMIMLFAIGMFYGQYDILNIAAIAKKMAYTQLDKIALGLLITAFALKCGAAPMHMWVPDSYGEAPASVTAILIVVSLTAFYALFRVVFTLYGYQLALNYVLIGWIIIILGLLSMFIGVTMALVQNDVKRLIAYSSVSQVGYMLMAFGVGVAVLGTDRALSLLAVKSGLFHMLNDVFYKSLLFLVAGALFYATKTSDLTKMGGLAHRMPLTTVFFIVGALAIAGVPPFNGFASKLLIYESVYKFNPVLSIIAIMVSIITLAIFVKVFQGAFMGPRLPEYADVREPPKSMLVSMGVLTVIVVLFGLFPGMIVDRVVSPAAVALVENAAKYVQYIGVGGG